MQETTLISNSKRTTLHQGALRWVGQVPADEAETPKPGSRDGPAYFAMLMLFGSWPFIKTNFCSEVCCVVSGSCEIRTRVFRAALPRAPRLAVTQSRTAPHLVFNLRKVFLCLITFCAISCKDISFSLYLLG